MLIDNTETFCKFMSLSLSCVDRFLQKSNRFTAALWQCECRGGFLVQDNFFCLKISFAFVCLENLLKWPNLKQLHVNVFIWPNTNLLFLFNFFIRGKFFKNYSTRNSVPFFKWRAYWNSFYSHSPTKKTHINLPICRVKNIIISRVWKRVNNFVNVWGRCSCFFSEHDYKFRLKIIKNQNFEHSSSYSALKFWGRIFKDS